VSTITAFGIFRDGNLPRSKDLIENKPSAAFGEYLTKSIL